MGIPCNGEALSNPPATRGDPGRAVKRLWQEGCPLWQIHVGEVFPEDDCVVTRAASHCGDGPVLGMHPDKTGQAAPRQRPAAKQLWPCWFKFIYLGLSQGNKCREQKGHRGQKTRRYPMRDQVLATTKSVFLSKSQDLLSFLNSTLPT